MNFNLINKKTPSCESEILNLKNGIITFINFDGFKKAIDSGLDYSKFDYISIDGIIFVKILNLFNKKQTLRISFDFGSIGKNIFEIANKKHKNAFIVGSNQISLSHFLNNLKSSYPNINFVGSNHGYFIDEKDMELCLKKIIKIEPQLVIVGMGCPLQDFFLIRLKEFGYNGLAFSCGGLIHQSEKSLNYYPKFVNRYNLRVFYRLIKERSILEKFKFFPFFLKKILLYKIFSKYI